MKSSRGVALRSAREKKTSRLQVREDHLRAGRAGAPVLRDAAPTATLVSVRLRFHVPTHAEQSFSLYPGARAYFEYPCPNGDCDGVFDLSGDAGRTLRKEKPQIAGALDCEGHRGAAHQRCGLRVSYTIYAEHARKT